MEWGFSIGRWAWYFHAQPHGYPLRLHVTRRYIVFTSRRLLLIAWWERN